MRCASELYYGISELQIDAEDKAMADEQKQDDPKTVAGDKSEELTDNALDQVSGGGIGSLNTGNRSSLNKTGWIEITGNVGTPIE